VIGPTTINFFDNNGKPMAVSFRTLTCTAASGCTTGNLITAPSSIFFLTPGAMIEVTFSGGSDTQFGHAEIASCSAGICSTAGLYAEVILKNTNSIRPDFESIFPLEQPAVDQLMTWDHRNGLSTLLYLVNPNSSTTNVTLTFVNQMVQKISTQTVTLPAFGSQIINLNALVPATIGLQGSLEIEGVNGTGNPVGLVATGLRINPTNSFTPLRAYVPSH
jgi:hypothetical protein